MPTSTVAPEATRRSSLAAMLALGLVATLVFAPTALAGQSVTIDDFFFSPSTNEAQQGTTFVWDNTGTFTHSVTSDAPFSYWPSTDVPPAGPNFQKTFKAAGTFPYHCRFHAEMVGKVKVPLIASDPSGRNFSLVAGTQDFATASPFRYVIQRRNPGSSTWVTLRDSRVRTAAYTGPLAGQYSFRSAVRRASNNAMSGWSRVVKITVP